MEDFTNWLIEEMNKRGWSNSELARRANVAQATVSLIVSGKRQPGTDFCLGIARAFRMPPEVVFRRAGLLPNREGIEEELFQRLRDYVEALSPARREELLRYVLFLHQLETERDDSISRGDSTNGGTTE